MRHSVVVVGMVVVVSVVGVVPVEVVCRRSDSSRTRSLAVEINK